MAFMAPALAGETEAPRRHSLIQRPIAPASPVAAHPESSVPPSRPVAAATPSVTPPSSLALPHKLLKKPVPPAAVAPLVSESTSAPRISSRLSSAGNLPVTLPPTVSDSISKSLPASVNDHPIVPIAPVPLSMSSHGAVATPASSRSLAAAAPSTAAAGSGPTSASLSPSMTRLMQLNPGFAALLQPSTPVVTSPSNTPPSATPPPSPPPVSSTGTVTLSWSANSESDLAGYRIYFGTSSGEYNAPGSPAIIGNLTSYTVAGLQRNTTYFFALSAYDSAGNESPLSVEVSRSIL
jgi:Fibronectin type III domain